MKKTLHVISHTHWDREWYMPFESHRYRLVEFFDRLLDTLDKDSSFKSFHLDGQAIVIEDYLAVKPQMLDKIKKYIDEGRLIVGPFYILQDEYLVDGESNIRNALIGRKVSEQYGEMCNIGYFPDAFGNVGQMPQILRGFGIEEVAFGRGLSPRKGDRLDTGEDNYGKFVSEVRWRSPDGSEVLGASFLHWYNNACEVPSDPEAAKAFVEKARDDAAAFAATPHLLLMNGCDHEPVQTDIGQIIDTLNRDSSFEDTIIHSNFPAYFRAIRPYQDQFGIFVGELDGEYSEGWHTLANTASARIYLKQLNAQCEAALEKRAEPLSVFASLLAGDPARIDYFDFVWKCLLHNHPHDSICGCSVDDVHAGMVTRFKGVLTATSELEKSELEALVKVINTAETGAPYAVTVFNPSGVAMNETVTVNLDLPGDTEITKDTIGLYDGEKPVACDIEDKGIVFDFILPKDRFRIPLYPHRFTLTFRACSVPALGYKTFGIRTDRAGQPDSDLVVYAKGMANKRLRVRFAGDGSLNVTDRKTGKAFTTGIFTDTGDIGDEYTYRQSSDCISVTTENSRAKIQLLNSSAAAVTFRVTHTMDIPAAIDRASGNRIGQARLIIESDYTLRAGADRLDVHTRILNNADNHRIVMLTYPEIETKTLLAEGQFDITERVIQPWEGWKNPTKPGKMTTFFGLEDADHGLLIAGRGLAEYEVLRDGRNTMSLTIHRGIDQLGDWGWFPTVDSQCRGELNVEYSLIPFTQKTADRERAVNAAYSFAAYMPAAICGKAVEGTVPMTKALFDLGGSGYIVSVLKINEERGTVILRVYNPYTYDGRMRLSGLEGFRSIYQTNMAEEPEHAMRIRNHTCTVNIPAKKILTFELVPLKVPEEI